jgi:hypothetical protein
VPNQVNTTSLSANERTREIASILATGIVRLRQRAALPSDDSSEMSETILPEGLDLSGKTRLSVLVG